ncbi:MAG: hypothetical protein HY231_26030 [Acidobacteria bacterium]|nr:hypothetical protein [Acidobacteriota bacterium]
MVFALATDELTLYVFPDEVTAISHCEGIDVEAAIWLFWNNEGVPLTVEFTIPIKRGMFSITNPTYHLVQNREFLQAPLLEALEDTEAVEGQPPLNSVTAIE